VTILNEYCLDFDLEVSFPLLHVFMQRKFPVGRVRVNLFVFSLAKCFFSVAAQ